ncbi:CocE/NonD family hydrolase [Jongsikchunia kroppenstedtii]|uniref:CocE/NonD family hydrolase n=1 Tax=Jongsikchunia kroppenstedtii TaxID=1121721 RepID=UPI0003A358A8|nr:CocE/NonD family hydrolase [Jongsikchunia kroppenstedtii]
MSITDADADAGRCTRITRRAVLLLATLAMVATMIGIGGPAAAAPSTHDTTMADSWTRTEDGPQKYSGVHIDWDVPIRMSDGIVLKANVYRPMDASGRVTTPIPTIVNMTPYTKLIYMLLESATAIPGLYDPIVDLMNRFDLFDLAGTPISAIGDQIRAISSGSARTISADPQLIKAGYAEVIVDVRGTGFSQGVWNGDGAREQQDVAEVARWAGNQPWSTKQIGTAGLSYGGISALQAAEQPNSPVKSVFAVVPGSDIIQDTIAPGGGFNAGFIPYWIMGIDTLKWLPDLRSIVTGTFDWKWLADRVSSPVTFFDTLLRALFTLDINNIPPDVNALIDPNKPFRQAIIGHPERIHAPTFVVGGWHDLFTNSEPDIINAIDLPDSKKKLLMGDWYHSTVGSGLGSTGRPPRVDVLQRAWFDKWLKGIDNGIDRYSPATLFQQGGAWTSAPSFPRPGMTYTRQYLTGTPSRTTGIVAFDGSITSRPPTGRADAVVSPGLSTVCSRDAAQGTAGMLGFIDGCAKDARVSEVAAATFTSAPVATSTAVSGPVSLHLNTKLETTDGYWTATLNDVAPDGQSTVVTSGQLTASLRKIDDSRSSRSANGDYTKPVPYISLADRQPVVPGRPTVLDIGFNPTDFVLQPGHRLRVDIFAANFPKSIMIPALMLKSQLRPQTIAIDPSAPSFINLPVSVPMR